MKSTIEIQPEMVTKAMGRQALKKLAKMNGKTIKEMRKILDECSRAGSEWARKAPRMLRKMTNVEKIKAIKKWQGNNRVHEMTCGKNSNHILVPKEVGKKGKKVILICPECDYTQERIPEVVFEMYLLDKLDKA